jgi:VanZ family protein
VLWAAVLFLLSSAPDLPGPSWVPYGDKVGHLGLYGLLGGTLAWGRENSGHRVPHALLVLLGVLYGVSDEWHQSFVPGRTPSGGDLAMDGVGLLVGYASGLSLLTRRGRGGLAPPPSAASPDPLSHV